MSQMEHRLMRNMLIASNLQCIIFDRTTPIYKK